VRVFSGSYFVADTVLEELTFGWPRRMEDMLMRQQLAMRLQAAVFAVLYLNQAFSVHGYCNLYLSDWVDFKWFEAAVLSRMVVLFDISIQSTTCLFRVLSVPVFGWNNVVYCPWTYGCERYFFSSVTVPCFVGWNGRYRF
jgi:hypothetical protein